MGEVIPIRGLWTDFDTALRDYVSDMTDGAVLTDFLLIAAASSPEDFDENRTRYCIITPRSQPPHVSLGLLKYADDNMQIDTDE